jgi:hypothetical protein
VSVSRALTSRREGAWPDELTVWSRRGGAGGDAAHESRCGTILAPRFVATPVLLPLQEDGPAISGPVTSSLKFCGGLGLCVYLEVAFQGNYKFFLNEDMRTGGVARVVECRSSKRKVLSSNPST